MSEAAAILELLNRKSTVTPRVARYAGAADGRALVDIGDERFPASFMTGTVPQIGEAVHVWAVDGSLFMVGPTTPKPGVGVIFTISGTRAVVRTDFGDFTMTVAPTDPMPSSGDTVGISWSTQPWCITLSEVPDPPEPPVIPGGGGGPTIHTAEFRARESGSTDRNRLRYWTNRPMASESTFGAWFYGSQIKDTIPANAELVSLEVYVSWAVRRYGPPRWVLHNLPGKTAVPGVSGAVEWDPTRGAGWFTPPNALEWFNGLKGGGPWWGIGFDRGGWEEARSLAEDGQSGALRIKWKA